MPEAIVRLADARADARASRDFVEADRLRAEIEAAGWQVVDRGFSYRLVPAHPPDVEVDGTIRYGRVDAVPSRLEESASGLATVVLVATDRPQALRRAIEALCRHAPPDTDAVLVADGPSDAQATALGELELVATHAGVPLEIVRTSARLGYGAALDIGARRARAEVVVVLDDRVEASGDVVTPLVDALADGSVAIAGGWGTMTADLRRFEAPAPSALGPAEVDVVGGEAMAFRRRDFVGRGPIDERFVLPGHAATWWSLVLRDEGEGRPPRRAVHVPLPARLHGTPLDTAAGPTAADPGGRAGERSRLEKRAFYRVLDRFGGRADLLSGAGRSEVASRP